MHFNVQKQFFRRLWGIGEKLLTQHQHFITFYVWHGDAAYLHSQLNKHNIKACGVTLSFI